MAISDFPMVITNAPWSAFPHQLPAICPNLQAVAEVLRFNFITHETKESHVNWGYANQKRFKVQAEVVTKTVENLRKKMTKKRKAQNLGM